MKKSRPVTLFIQCLIDGIYPEVAEAVVTVFRRLGVHLDYPVDQTCCGQPAFNTGYWNEARTAARRFIDIFEEAQVIVCPSGSCVTMVRHHYPDLFRDDPGWRVRAEAVAAKTFEFTEYLVDVLGVEDLGARFPGKVTYHDSCHLLRHLGIARQPRALLDKVRGVERVEMKDSDHCCGFGGAFSVKYPEISTAMVDEKIRNILDSGADTVTGCDMGCLMNIQGRLSRKEIPVKTLHIAQILAGTPK
ncbi:MAG: (Fe-S)-binding protein [Pseudomonadota bacterium]